jgi:hypothetical protein
MQFLFQMWSRILVFLVSLSSAVAGTPARTTWSTNIAPIVYEHCVTCHRPGQPAPFSLLTYEDARRRADLIAHVTAARYMPPWKPVAGYGHFADERHLPDHDIAAIAAWAREGAPAGNLKLAPAPPQFSSDWQLGQPDVVLSLPQPYDVPADGPDQYRCFVIPTGFAQDRYVHAFEFAPGPGSVLHHSLMFVDARRTSASSHSLPEPYDCFGTPGFLPTAGLGGWTPGSRAVSMAPGTAVHIPRGARIVMQLHFHPTGKAESICPRLALYFAHEPPPRVLMDVGLGSNHIDIPASDRAYKITDHFEIPVPLQVVGIIPHAHYICKDIKAWAVLPDGRRRWLIWIRDWDFNWQEQYRYADPFTLPADTRIEVAFTYDNSEANVRNPNLPPQRVTWGPSSTDEMAGLHLQVIPKDEADMHALGQALWGKVMRAVGGSFYRLPKPAPE